MKRALLISVLAAVALAAGSVPARASAASWEDPAGDATAVGAEQTVAADTSPRPSDPELDARTVGFAVQGDSIVATAKMEAGGIAAGSGGSIWRFFFSHKQDRYYFQSAAASAEYSQAGFSSTPGFYRLAPDDPDPTSNGEELRCDCKMTVKLDEGTVQFAIKTAAVAKTLKAAPGAIELSNLELRTFRRAQFYVLSDVALAPESLKFKA